MRSGLFLMGPAQTELLPQFSWEALQVCEPLGESASVNAGGSDAAIQGCFSKMPNLGVNSQMFFEKLAPFAGVTQGQLRAKRHKFALIRVNSWLNGFLFVAIEDRKSAEN